MTGLVRSLVPGTVLLSMLVSPLPACAQQAGENPPRTAGEKPLLSQVIKTTIEKDGAEAAKRRFQEILKDRDNYRLDPEGMSALGGQYLQQGDIERGTVVMEMTMTLYQETTSAIRAGLPPPPPPPPPAAPPPPPAPALDFGPARTDLQRFFGVYGDPENQRGMARNVFVMIRCSPGHIDFGAMWGDVSPWTMKSLGDTEFVQGFIPEGQPVPVRVSFHLGPGGRAIALSHSLLSATGEMTRVPRLSDIPADWPPPFCDRGR